MKNIDTSFCSGCNSYLSPEQSQIAWVSPGIAKTMCKTCKEMLYHDRIEQECSRMNLSRMESPCDLPLFAGLIT